MSRGLLSNEIESTNKKDSRQTLILLWAGLRIMELDHNREFQYLSCSFRTSIQAHLQPSLPITQTQKLRVKWRGGGRRWGEAPTDTETWGLENKKKKRKTNWPNYSITKIYQCTKQERISYTILKALSSVRRKPWLTRYLRQVYNKKD